MTWKRDNLKRGGLRLFILLTGLLVLWSQKGQLVTAEEPTARIDIPAPALSDEAPQTGLPQVALHLAGHTFTLDMAVTPAQNQKGLMYRTHLPPDQGMLFRFQPPRPVNFWMKNTKIPLDIIFIRRGHVVHVVHSAPPCTADPCPEYSSIMPVDSAVELNGGTAQKYGIEAGLKAVLSPLQESPVPQSSPPLPAVSDQIPERQVSTGK